MTEQESPLFKGILSDAEEKGKAIINEAETEAKTILEKGREQAEKAVEVEKRSADIKLESLRLKEESAKRNADRLASLQELNSSYEEVMKRVNVLLKTKEKDSEWVHKALVSWIAEAALGLGLDVALVSSSIKGRVTDDMLREAEALLKAKAGVIVSLSQDAKMCPDFGVVLSSKDGKISYDNRMATRMRRRQREIRMCVQEFICKAE